MGINDEAGEFSALPPGWSQEMKEEVILARVPHGYDPPRGQE